MSISRMAFIFENGPSIPVILSTLADAVTTFACVFFLFKCRNQNKA